MCILESTLSACPFDVNNRVFWTAGQRINPYSNTRFVWKTSSATVSEQSFTSWIAGQPDFYQSDESCMVLQGGDSYQWNDLRCSNPYCYVCEVD